MAEVPAFEGGVQCDGVPNLHPNHGTPARNLVDVTPRLDKARSPQRVAASSAGLVLNSSLSLSPTQIATCARERRPRTVGLWITLAGATTFADTEFPSI